MRQNKILFSKRESNTHPLDLYLPVLLFLSILVLVYFSISRNTKLFETGYCFAEFRSLRETEKNMKYEKKCFELFRETAKQRFVLHFRIFFR